MEYIFSLNQRLRRRFFFAGFLPRGLRAEGLDLEAFGSKRESRVFLGSLAQIMSYESRSSRASSSGESASLFSSATH